jgi:hypothetical protein
MNFNQAEASIRKYFNAQWAGLTPIAWPDTNFVPPSGETWVRFNCQEINGEQSTMGSPGSNRFRHSGIITIQVFQPQGQNSRDARVKATAAIAAFMGVENEGILFFNVQGRQLGNDGQGYYQINVLASFRYDEIT